MQAIKTLLAPLLSYLCHSGYLFSQETGPLLEQKLESTAEVPENEETDYAQLQETLNYFKEHPLNLNRAEADEISALRLLDDILIKNLLDHKDKNGKLLCIYELQTIDGFDVFVIENILPYIMVEDNTGQQEVSLKNAILKGRHELITRISRVLEKETGFAAIDSTAILKSPNSRYIGSPEKIYLRYRFRFANHISAGITMEKDAGELFFKRNQRFKYPAYESMLEGKQKNGFDFYSAHFFLANVKFIRALAIGDYHFGFGQGLVSAAGLSYSHTSDAVGIKKNPPGIRPHTSSDENRFMRGIALTAGKKHLQATGFFSQKRMDASGGPDSSLIYSLPATGLHSTPSEIAGRKSVIQTSFGGNISYRKRKFSAGLTGTQMALSAMLAKDASSYRQFKFSGQQLSNIGADYNILLHNLNFFGEIGIAGNKAFAYLNGCIASLDPRLSFALMHRSYQRNYQSMYAGGFSQNTETNNEHGFYLGIAAKLANSITINAYYDQVVFPWMKYQVNTPSESNEFLIQVNYAPNKKFETYLRFRHKAKWENTSNQPGEEIDFISPLAQHNCRWNLAYRISPSLELRNRIEALRLNNPTGADEDGFLVTQDALWKPPSFRQFSITARYALFDTKSYDSRIYTYEADVPGAYSIPAYYFKGSRAYAIIHYEISRKFEIWLRWSQTSYSNRNTISPGSLSEISGNQKNDVRLQVRLYF